MPAVGALQGLMHVLGDGAGDHQHVSMARGGDTAQAEALQIVESIVEGVDLELAAVAGAGVDLADRQRAAQAAARGRSRLCASSASAASSRGGGASVTADWNRLSNSSLRIGDS
jgi:hypothetical protein